VRKIAVPIIDRANYGRLLPVLLEIAKHPKLELHLILGGSFVLERFGRPWEMLDEDELSQFVTARCYNAVEGNISKTMASSAGLGLMEFSGVLADLKPDIMVAIGDRFEMLSAVTAAHLCGICIVHLQGGEHTGHIDDRTRNAITALAQYHCPATKSAKKSLVTRGESSESILTVGCPSSDLIFKLLAKCKRSNIVSFHPDADDPNWSKLATALVRVVEKMDDIEFWWPNIDAGSDHLSRELRRHKQINTVKHLHPREYIYRLSIAKTVIGNSSSFVREASFFGVPAIMIGLRQIRRESSNIVSLINTPEQIRDTLPVTVMNHEDDFLERRSPYFFPGVSKKIVKALNEVVLRTSKNVHRIVSSGIYVNNIKKNRKTAKAR
jgi:UDP-hydrolysing UDP-N-acetyl-D-glucosamine 2-epimerase